MKSFNNFDFFVSFPGMFFLFNFADIKLEALIKNEKKKLLCLIL